MHTNVKVENGRLADLKSKSIHQMMALYCLQATIIATTKQKILEMTQSSVCNVGPNHHNLNFWNKFPLKSPKKTNSISQKHSNQTVIVQ